MRRYVSSRLYNAIGLCMKAGKCRSGDGVVEDLLKKGGVLLILLDEGASDATKDRYEHACSRRKIPLLLCRNAGEAIGKPGRMVIAVTDPGFAGMITAAYEAETMKTTDGPEPENNQR